MSEEEVKREFKTKRDEDYYNKVMEHKEAVKRYMNKIVTSIKKRAESHDDTKLEEPEFTPMSKTYANLSTTTYGSDEYHELLEELKEPLKCHYAKNRHHPEHFSKGIKDMNLIDLIEMLCDWYAATEKHDDGNIKTSIEHNKERFGFTKELEQIFKNTIEFLDIKTE